MELLHGISNPQPYTSHLTVPHLSSLPSCLFRKDPGFRLAPFQLHVGKSNLASFCSLPALVGNSLPDQEGF